MYDTSKAEADSESATPRLRLRPKSTLRLARIQASGEVSRLRRQPSGPIFYNAEKEGGGQKPRRLLYQE